MHIRFFQDSFLVLLASDLNIVQSVYGVMDPTLSFFIGTWGFFMELDEWWGWEDASISQTVLKMNQYKNLAEDYIFSTEPDVSIEMMPWLPQFFVGGKKVMEVFSCLSRGGRGRNECDSSQLPSVLPLPLHAEAHPG